MLVGLDVRADAVAERVRADVLVTPIRAELTIEWSAMKEPDSKVVRCGR